MSNTLDTLLVFDELIVGPIKLESNRVTAPYTLIVDGTRDTFELIYRFEEAVFDPSDPVSQNLAAMMAVQPALNYGLFCRKLVFNGMFDDPDRRFLRAHGRKHCPRNHGQEISATQSFHHRPGG